VNQKGRTERIHVNLEAIYPTPEIVGSELSLEELRADHRGWLSKVWIAEVPKKPSSKLVPIYRDNTEGPKVNKTTREVSDKLVIHRDPVTLDENGAKKDSARESKGRRMKIKEVNETQISMLPLMMYFTLPNGL
jgi:checkpoint serine/threonine-protein kinase